MRHIRRQVVWLSLAPLLLLTFCITGLYLHDRYNELDQALIANARTIASKLAAGNHLGDEYLRKQIALDFQSVDVKSISVVDAQENTRISAVNLKADQLQNHPTREKYRVRFPLYSNGSSQARQNGEVIVEMSASSTDLQKLRLLAWALMITAIFLSVSIYLLLLASRRITFPINKLCADLRHFAQSNPLAEQFTVTTDACELESLAQNINLLTTKLQSEHEHLQRSIEEETQILRKQKQEAERNSLNSSRFLAVASHELRQPLHALSLYIAELQRKVFGAELQHLVGQLNHSVEVLTNMLNGLLDISKLDARTILPQIQICSVAGLLERVSASHVMVARIKNVRLVVRPCTCYVTSDPALLERIMMNLVGNAIRYTEPGGSVLVACRHRGNHIQLEVRDNGIGIAPEDHEQIFREFHQCKQPKLDTSKGLGLGLAIVSRLTKLLDHKLTLHSIPNKGSVFALEVPSAHEPEISDEQSPAQVVTVSHMAGKRILIVDDDPLILESTVHILGAWGCNVSSADSLKSVTQRLAAGEEWDLIITDYQLDDHITGLHIINAVKENHKRSIPCILITGNTSQELSKLINAGGGHVLYKPVRPAKLRSLIEFLLSGESIPPEYSAGTTNNSV
ncbi:MAG: ATP-binding protein [Gallionella sp.]|nr:ATP-binding protein [Gallionella sp.]MDD4946480.1 ATP-binding protein [Gallionella sp.]